MKRLYVFAAVAAILTLASCNREPEIVIQNTPAVDVTNQKLDPNANESGTVRAYAGTQVTAKGLNLDRVGSVKVDGVDATIVSKEMKTLVFEIPVLNKPQQDDPYMVDLEVFEEGTDKRIFNYDYYVTVPVTDAIVTGFTPAEGTVGEEVTIAGRNLEQITSVSFGGVSVAADAFVSSASAAVVVAVPAVVVTEADTQLDVSAVWAGGTIALDGKFTLHVPVFTSYSQAAPALLGDEIVLPGANLDLVKAIKWGDTSLLISEQSAASITIKVPTGLELQNPAVVSKALTAVYGVKEDQVITIAASFQVDTTPVGPAAPVFASVENADAAYGTSFYLGKELVVKGSNFATVEGFKIDGITVTVSAESTDIEARFVVPSTITGTAAKEVSLVALWNGGNELDCGTVTVYPFYYTKGLKIGLGSNTKNYYPAFNSQNAFILLDEGRVISADDWNDIPVDAPAKTAAVVKAQNKATDGTKEQYYSAKPYMFATASSSHKLAFQNPANSSSQLKTHRLSDLSTSLPSNFGTPLIFMKIMGDGDTKTNVAAGTLTDILSNTSIAGTSAPAFGKTEGDTWVKGSVICLQYLTYEHASTTGGKAVDISDVYKTGYMYIRDITCGDTATGLALESREGYIEIDLYWSNVL